MCQKSFGTNFNKLIIFGLTAHVLIVVTARYSTSITRDILIHGNNATIERSLQFFAKRSDINSDIFDMSHGYCKNFTAYEIQNI